MSSPDPLQPGVEPLRTVDQPAGEVISPTGLRVEAPLAEKAPAAPADDGWAEENFYRVVLNLEAGDWVEIETFADEQSAEACAAELVEALAEAKSWPRVRGRYLRPETIMSVEVSERRRYTGSAARSSWGQSLD
ncbi:MAG: hypothetical protein ACR2L0_09095 [Gaiellaceae bacterium]